MFGSAGGPTVSIPEGFPLAVQNLADCSPGLGRPLLATLESSGVQGLRNHPLRARWADQSAWSEEIFRLRSVAFDASADQRLQGLRSAQECAGAGLWLTATPGSSSFEASEWQLLLRFRVGAFCFTQNAECSLRRVPEADGRRWRPRLELPQQRNVPAP